MKYQCDWQHGPAPGLTYYDGTITVVADDPEEAKRKARRLVAQRGCFDPLCIKITTCREEL